MLTRYGLRARKRFKRRSRVTSRRPLRGLALRLSLRALQRQQRLELLNSSPNVLELPAFGVPLLSPCVLKSALHERGETVASILLHSTRVSRLVGGMRSRLHAFASALRCIVCEPLKPVVTSLRKHRFRNCRQV